MTSPGWYYAKDGDQIGPVTAAQLKKLAETGELTSDCRVWRDGMKEWKLVSEIPRLAALLKQDPPSASQPRQPQSPVVAPDRVPARPEHYTSLRKAIATAIIAMYSVLLVLAILLEVANPDHSSQGILIRITNVIIFTALIGGAIVLYFAPSLVAVSRQHRNLVPIAIVNFFFGWTCLGWVGCLAWSFMAMDRPK